MTVDHRTISTSDRTALREALLRHRLEGGSSTAGATRTVPPVDRDGPLPLSSGQQQMWFLQQLDPESTEYLVPVVLRLRGTLDTGALARALTTIVARHEVLRTRYEQRGEDATQVIDEPATLPMPISDVAEDRAADVLDDEISVPFDLGRQWPVRARLLRLAPDHHMLCVTFHHIACDAWSVQIFARELGACYRDEGDLPAPTLQYADFAAWQQDRLQGCAADADVEYWRSTLSGAQPLELPLDRPRSPIRQTDGSAVEMIVGEAEADRLRALASSRGTTLFSVLLAGFAVVLGRYGDTTDVPIGTVVSVRDRAELTGMLGYAINTLVTRLRWTDDPTFGELVEAAAQVATEAFEHQNAPFARLVDELEPDRDLARTPLFQTALVMHEERGRGFDLPGLSVEPLLEDRVARFDLTLDVAHTPTGPLPARLAYATAIFDLATIEALATHLHRVLATVAEDPGRALSSIRMLDATEAAEIARLDDDTPVPAEVADGTTAGRTGVRLLDADGSPAPTGAVGHLHLREAGTLVDTGRRARRRGDGALEVLTAAPDLAIATDPDDTTGTSGRSVAFVAAGSVTERAIATRWAEVLGLDTDQVGIHDHFFAHGGDSMRAVRLAGLLRHDGYDLTIRDIFEHGTIAALAATTPTTDTALIDPVAPYTLITEHDRARLPHDITDAYPLSGVQTGMVVEMLNRTDRAAYHSVTSFRIPDPHPFDHHALTRALTEITARHDILRTSISLNDYSQPLQLVHHHAEIPHHIHDLRGLDPEQQTHTLEDFVATERAHLLDLDTAPLMRLTIHLETDTTWRITFTQCHAITDGWSLHTLLMQLLDRYRAERDGRPVAESGTEGAVRYADVVAAELAALDDPAHRDYWRTLTTTHTPFALPGAWLRGDDRGPVRHPVRFDDLAPRLREVARETGTSLKTVLLTAHLHVLATLTSDHHIHTGLVCHARLEAPGSDQILGMHLNTVPFPHDTTRPGTWRTHLHTTYHHETHTWNHRRYPLPAITRTTGTTDRLLTVAFEYLDFHQLEDGLQRGDGGAQNEFDLTVVVNDGVLYLSGGTAVGRRTAERLAAMYRRVLEAIAADPDADAAGAALPADERALVLDDWGRTAGAVPTRATHVAFGDQAARTPQAVALTFAGGSLTYAELDARANQIAHRLHDLGAGPDHLVGVHLDRGPDLVATLLGIWKAGAAYVPLDPSLPGARRDHMIADTGAALIVTSRARRPALDGHDGLRALVLDGDDEADVAAAPRTAPGSGAGIDHLAYVMYTSGSTGTPKGVLTHHRGLANYVEFTAEAYARAGGGGSAMFSPISFDLGLPDLLTPLTLGQRVHLLPEDLELTDLGAELAAAGPFGFIKLTPGHLDLLAHQLDAEQAHDLAGLLIGAGDSFSSHLVRRWRALAGEDGTALAGEYGPTETSIGNSGDPIGPVPATELVPLGRPIPNTSMYVLDQHLEPTPVGVVGEIYIGGVALARGYHGRPGLSAERFVPDPHGEPGSRLYRTGDLGRFDEAGELEFLGRTDHQVKIRGFRVELGEVQSALAAHPEIAEAIVVPADGGNSGSSLAAYLVPAHDAAGIPSAEELRERLATVLPPYMVPASYTSIDEIPLTGNGKVDRTALPDPGRQAFGSVAFVAAGSVTERAIATRWAEVLGLDTDQVGIHDHFFAHGGDSMRAVRLAGLLRHDGYDLTIRDIFEHGTIAALAATTPTTDTALIDPVAPYTLITEHDRARLPHDITDAYPLSGVQTGMVVEMLNRTDRAAYHSVTSFRIPDPHPFDHHALTRALTEITARHDILRTSISLNDYSQPLQLVHHHAEIPHHIHDLRGLDPEQQTHTLEDFVATERAHLLDLDTAPLMRLTIHLETDTTWRITFTQCHAITDGWSYHTLLMQLLDTYKTLRDDPEADLRDDDTGGVRYADVVAAELAALDDPAHRDYWRTLTTTHTPFALPDRWGEASTAGPHEPGRAFHVRVPFADLEPQLREVARETGTSLKTVLLTAHLHVLATLTPDHHIHTGLVCHARLEAPGSDQILGMHLNTVPFPHDTTRPGTWRTHLHTTYHHETHTWNHRRYPLPAITRTTGTTDRLVRVSFNVLDFHQVDTNAVDLDGGFGVGGNELDMSVFAVHKHLVLGPNPRVLNRENAERLAVMYRRTLEAIAADPDADAAIAMLPGDERHSQLLTWNDTATAWPDDATTLDLIEAAAARTPDTPAVVTAQYPSAAPNPSAGLSYAELDARANQIAHRLHDLGAGPDHLVGVHLDRGPDLVATLLGIWKAGAAYVPLDPSNPAQRLTHVLADSGVRILVSDGTENLDHDGVRLTVHDPALDEQPTTPPNRSDDPDRLAYVIYTSGSTGAPKGTLITHRGLANHLRWAATEFGTATHGAPLFSSIAFDLPSTNLYVPLCTGRTVTVLPSDVPPAELGAALVHSGPYGFVKLTPGHLDLLSTQVGDGDLVGLADRILVAGEALTARSANRWMRLLGPGRLVNEYGPTECTVGTTAFPIVEEQQGTAPLGVPLPNMTVYVLNQQLEPMAVGATGEVYVGGTGLGRGYLGRPGLTAERFLPHPHGGPGARLYRTGDLGRFRADGVLEFLGRVDDQVKVRGYRVELGEIEHALTATPTVAEATVVVRSTEAVSALVAFVVADRGVEADPERIRRDLAQRVPAYMVPTRVVVLDRLPLTANGKVDRTALLELDPAQDVPARAVEPSLDTDTERALAQVWRDVLDLPRVDRGDSFFELGGDSILAVRMLAGARTAGIPLAVWMIYQVETLAELATLGEEAAAQTTPAEQPEEGGKPEANPVESDEPGRHPLPAERRPGLAPYRVRVSPRRRLDPSVLAPAMQAVAAHHPALAGEEPVLRVVELATVPADRHDEVTTTALDRAGDELAAAGPRMAAVLVVPADDTLLESTLIGDLWLLVHASAVDVGSCAILAGDLDRAYDHLEAGGGAALPPVPTPVGTWARRLHDPETIEDLLVQAPQWLPAVRLPGADGSDGPLDGSESIGGEPPYEVATVIPLPARTEDSDLEAAAVTALARVLAERAESDGSDGVDLDLGHDPRCEPDQEHDLSRTVGPLAEEVPITVRGAGGADRRRALRRVRGELDALPRPRWGHAVLRDLAPDPAVAAQLARHRPRTVLTVVPAAEGSPEGTVLSAPQVTPPHGGHDVAVALRCVRGRVFARWTARPGAPEARTLDALAEAFRAEFVAMIGEGRPVAAPRAEPADAVEDVMAAHGIPGAVLGRIEAGELVSVQAHGVADAGTRHPVTEDTLFPAASMTKHATTFAALRVVEERGLDLDADVGAFLTSWRPPRVAEAPMTLRHLLANLAGLRPPSSSRRQGYHVDEELPSVLDVLTGRPPAAPEPASAQDRPGQVFRLNNLHYCVLQRVLEDVTGESYPDLLHRLVLDPVGMSSSGLAPRYPTAPGLPVAHGHDLEGRPLEGGYRVYPETAARGLWTTAADLARLSLAVRAAYLGGPGALLDRGTVEPMLTARRDRPYGWGTIVDDSGQDLEFAHGGQAAGYQGMFWLRARSGTGAIVLTNSVTGRALVTHLMSTGWADTERLASFWGRAMDAARAREGADAS